MTEYFNVIGKGQIGDKARELMEKTPYLVEIGFYAPRRTVLAEDYFDGFFQKNRLGKNLREIEIADGLEQRIMEGMFTEEEFEVLRGIGCSYPEKFLISRSSGKKDARGTGIYRSEFTENVPEKLATSVKSVLTSYFSEEAIIFREKAGIEEGFGVMIEPLIGQYIGEGFAPVLSGFGYTSTARGEGYVVVVPGIGGGVDTRRGETITESQIKDFGGKLTDYILSEIKKIANIYKDSTLLIKDPLCTVSSFESMYIFAGKAVYYEDYSDEFTVKYVTLDFKKAGIDDYFEELNLLPLFDMMRKMEDRFGKPQYFEWALTFDSGEPKYWIIQTADIDKKLDIMDFSDPGNIILTGHSVLGTGAKDCDKIIICKSVYDISSLDKFNKKNKDYILIFPGTLISQGVISFSKLEYNHIYNASTLLENPGKHFSRPVDHFGGRLEESGIFFGILDNNPETGAWKVPEEIFDERLEVYKGKFRVVSSERQNRIIVSVVE
ncbi:MAG: hypothetical protein DRP13_01685 [Candidatus Aenigmatarchaeota archaeon]|nr:MAG: hypothetical protein DRP13_01685 [Candidatus Aenigmarchaeota archaeon]